MDCRVNGPGITVVAECLRISKDLREFRANLGQPRNLRQIIARKGFELGELLGCVVNAVLKWAKCTDLAVYDVTVHTALYIGEVAEQRLDGQQNLISMFAPVKRSFQ